MKTSDSTKAFWPAFFAAQKASLPARKSAINSHLKNKYADLSSVLEACEEALRMHDLMVVPSPATHPNIGVVLATRIIHVPSGEWIENELNMPAGKGDAQAIGSAITYARRYALTSLLNLSTEDDDGEAAQGRGKAAAASNGHGPAAPTETNYATVAEQIRDAIKRGRLDWAEGGFRKYFGKGSPAELRAAVWADIEAAKKAAPQNGARS